MSVFKIRLEEKKSHIILLYLCLHLNSEFTANEGQIFSNLPRDLPDKSSSAA